MTRRLLVEKFPDAKQKEALEKKLEQFRAKLNEEDMKFAEAEISKIKTNLKQ